ncbi:Hypothetical predicted protein [Podarcis lilfordi]|uniref:Uncharacterized protein n=1 Tax=Podarcis lilfordi TaxID=74358 RepID=A0AA35P4B5_9SAUR|nr:Hypothetical predicted protein [Podarcis lilfordi]
MANGGPHISWGQNFLPQCHASYHINWIHKENTKRTCISLVRSKEPNSTRMKASCVSEAPKLEMTSTSPINKTRISGRIIP